MTGNKANKEHYPSSDSRAQKFLKKVTFAQSKAYDELFTRIIYKNLHSTLCNVSSSVINFKIPKTQILEELLDFR